MNFNINNVLSLPDTFSKPDVRFFFSMYRIHAFLKIFLTGINFRLLPGNTSRLYVYFGNGNCNISRLPAKKTFVIH